MMEKVPSFEENPDYLRQYHAFLSYFRSGTVDRMGEFYKPLRGLENSGTGDTIVIGCMDEGCACVDREKLSMHLGMGSGRKIAVVSFPMFPAIPSGSVVANLKRMVGEGPESVVVTTHEGCGAAGLRAAAMGTTPDDAAREWIMELSDGLRSMCGDVRSEHVPATLMNRPADLHDARIAYVNVTPDRAWNPIAAGMPKGYVIDLGTIMDPKDFGSDEVRTLLGLPTTISFGPHGLGQERLTAADPFLFLLMGTPSDSGAVRTIGETLRGIVGKYGEAAEMANLEIPVRR